jgi:hypothetical protein
MASKFILIPWARYQTLLALEDGTHFTDRGERTESCQAGKKSSSTAETLISRQSPRTVPEAEDGWPSAVHPSVAPKFGSPQRPKTVGRSQEGASEHQSGLGSEADEEERKLDFSLKPPGVRIKKWIRWRPKK